MSDPTTDPALRDLVCLTLIAGVGPQTSRALLDHFGTAGRILDASTSALREVPGVGPKLADRIARARRDLDPGLELDLCRRHGVRLLPASSADYPASLREIPDPPPLLYLRGGLEPSDEAAVAIVGSRRCTPYGLRMAARLAGSLARAGVTVVSGLARGIDAAAHRGALEAGGRTLAVLANGLAGVYPPEHDELAREVAAAGALLSEMPMQQEPLAGLFPQRNRIISGMSLGVVVVEATPRSGSLVTARHAVEQNREVFAVPGPADSLPSRGCHGLIRDGARLVETVDDILEELGSRLRPTRPAPVVDPGPEPSITSEATAPRAPAVAGLSDAEVRLLDQLDDQPRGVDELIGRTGLPAAQVLANLSLLELRRLVRRLPGHQFVRA